MGKICYRPKKNREDKENLNKQNMYLDEGAQVDEQSQMESVPEEEIIKEQMFSEDELEQDFTAYEEVIETQEDLETSNMREIPYKTRHEKKKLDNVKMVGDMDCDYHIYMEDYVYTYIYQYAFSDLSKENAAILIGEVYLDSKEAIITGMIPVDVTKLTDGSEWINLEVVNEMEEVRKQYFKDQDIIGWLHMQPGYGTMLTMKELREHRSVFEGTGSVFMLVDALNKVETVYVYEEEELKEQSGYCMYYEPNEPMQQYMVEHPFAKKETEEIKDTVVNQFREIGKLRKEEYLQKKNMSFTIMAAAVILVALAGIIVRMNDSNTIKDGQATTAMSNTLDTVNAGATDNVDVVVAPNKELGNIVGESDLNSEDKKEIPADEVQGDRDNLEIVNKTEETEKEDSDRVTETVVKEEVEETTKKDTEEIADDDYDIYVVKQGDTLANISYDKYGDAKKSLEIAKINGLDSTNNIYVGQELKVPKN